MDKDTLTRIEERLRDTDPKLSKDYSSVDLLWSAYNLQYEIMMERLHDIQAESRRREET